MVNPSLSRQFTLTNFIWKLRANGHLKGEKIGAVNYLKLSRIPTDIRIFWNFTNNRDTAFSVDELVRGFKINERDAAGNAKTLDNVWLWSEGEIPIEPLSDIIEIEYNGAGDLIEPLLGNKSGTIDKIEKVQVVSAIDKVLNPIKVVQTNNAQGYQIDDFYRINANIKKPTQVEKYIQVDYGDKAEDIKRDDYQNGNNKFDVTGYYRQGSAWNICKYQNTSWGSNALSQWTGSMPLLRTKDKAIRGFAKNCIDKKGKLDSNFRIGLESSLDYMQNTSSVYRSNKVIWSEGYYKHSENTYDSRGVNIGLANKVYTSFFANGVFENFLKITDSDGSDDGYTPCKGWGSIVPLQNTILAKVLWETTYDESLGLFIFKTKNKTSFIAPIQTQEVYVSLLSSGNNKKADFKITLAELSKTSSQDCALYIGGLDGIKVPIKSGFELCFNNKKTGMDYAVIEIPAGDIYKIELELLNVYEDSNV